MNSSDPATRHFVVGTSGHIDHGKTTLVKALTGVDADRFAEEKRRGITIDLGFAQYEDETGVRFAFVDVPGHEKFVHNMLAGVAGFDAVLLVVAADEGVMPQTREHLNICRLLRIPNGLVALTRVDLVEDREMVELCRDEVSELTRGTFLEGKPVIPVSSVTGEGLHELKVGLRDLSGGLTPPDLEHPFRLFVDRSFSVKGFGTVVTGTALSGKVAVDEEVMQYPRMENVRVRGIQVHGASVSEGIAGQRAALNLAGISQEDIRRGDQLSREGTLLTSYMLNVQMSVLEDAQIPLVNRMRVRFHLGSREVMGRVILLEEETASPGSAFLTQLRLEEQVSSRYGDRFIIRSYSPQHTLGGGKIIDPAPGKSRRVQHRLTEKLQRLCGDKQDSRIEEVIYLQSVRGVKEQEISVRSGLSGRQSAKVLKTLQSQKRVLCVDPVEKRYLHAEHVDRIGGFLQRVLHAHHQRFPEREGMNRGELGGKLSLLFHDREMEALLKALVKSETLALHDRYYSLPGHKQRVSSQTRELLQQCIELVSEGGYQPMRRTHLLQKMGMQEKDGNALLKTAVHEKKLVRVAEDLHYAPEQLDSAIEKLSDYFTKNTQITVIEFKELLGISRKHAVELLEYFDTQRLTVRHENHRTAGLLN